MSLIVETYRNARAMAPGVRATEAGFTVRVGRIDRELLAKGNWEK